MAHFAEIGLNNVVQQVIVISNTELLDNDGVEQESKGQEFCRNLLGGTWVQTSYNATFRKNYAGIGYTYDQTRNAFIPPKPYPSWTLNETTCVWQAPTPVPQDGKLYAWNENLQAWAETTI